MNDPLLSILIPTVIGRENEFNALKKLLESMSKELPSGLIECRVMVDDKKMTIGEKRERLYKQANGLYSWMIDDDDSIAYNSVQLILKAISENPDCITFKENCIMNGYYYTCNHSLKYDDWKNDFDGFDFVRTPFYKDVIKTKIARSIPFEHIRYGEDHAWSRALKPNLKTEVHIDEELYFYIHNSKPEQFNERYGITQ